VNQISRPTFQTQLPNRISTPTSHVDLPRRPSRLSLVEPWLGRGWPWSVQPLSGPWQVYPRKAGVTPGLALVGSWLAMVGPAPGWTLANLAQRWCHPWLATERALVGPRLGMVGPSLGVTLQGVWALPCKDCGPFVGSCSALVGPELDRIWANLLHSCFSD